MLFMFTLRSLWSFLGYSESVADPIDDEALRASEIPDVFPISKAQLTMI